MSNKPIHTPLSRDKVGRYDVLRPVASGGMGSVFLGRLTGMAGFQKLVAIKVIHGHLCEQRSFIDMFLDEARLAARIHHPNVSEILEVGEDDGVYFMVGEFVDGQNLLSMFRRAMHKKIAIPHSVSSWIIACTCDGLHAAHELKDLNGEPMKLVHRDISPLNILISNAGFIKLIDFGVASARNQMAETDDGALKGKVGYMCPEQIRGEGVERRGDLFSLGIVLYRMVTGRHPFSGKTDKERLAGILAGKYTRPSELIPDIDPAFEKIIIKALENDPDKRYQTAKEMRVDLEQYNRASEIEASTGIVSKLMHKLFDNEISESAEQLRELAEKHEGSEDNYLWQMNDRKKGGNFKRNMALSVGAALVIALLAYFVFPESSDNPLQPASATPASAVPASDLKSNPKIADEAVKNRGISNKEAGGDDSKTNEEGVEEAAKLVKMTLDIEPDNALIIFDGKQLEAGTKTLSVTRDGATHVVAVSAPGYKSLEKQFVADADKTVSLSLSRELKKSRHKKRPKKKSKLKRSPYE
jgi:serine/threonine protein kinase